MREIVYMVTGAIPVSSTLVIDNCSQKLLYCRFDRGSNENNITKFIIITGLLYVFCSIHSVVLVSINRFEVFKKYYYDFFAVLIRFGYFFLAPLILIFNAVIVFFYDRNLRHIFVTNTQRILFDHFQAFSFILSHNLS